MKALLAICSVACACLAVRADRGPAVLDRPAGSSCRTWVADARTYLAVTNETAQSLSGTVTLNEIYEKALVEKGTGTAEIDGRWIEIELPPKGAFTLRLGKAGAVAPPAERAARGADARRTLKTRDAALPSSPARTEAGKLVPIKTCTGFPQDLVRVPKAERIDLIGEYIYGPLVNIGINADGKKTLARLIREAEYERGFTADEATVRRITGEIRYLARWGYFSLR